MLIQWGLNRVNRSFSTSDYIYGLKPINGEKWQVKPVVPSKILKLD